MNQKLLANYFLFLFLLKIILFKLKEYHFLLVERKNRDTFSINNVNNNLFNQEN